LVVQPDALPPTGALLEPAAPPLVPPTGALKDPAAPPAPASCGPMLLFDEPQPKHAAARKTRVHDPMRSILAV
jgi:hypothetical protein